MSSAARQPLGEIPAEWFEEGEDEHAPGFDWYHDPTSFRSHALVVTEEARYTPHVEACRPPVATTVYWIVRPARVGDPARRVMWRSPATVSVETPGGFVVRLVVCGRFASMAESKTYECPREDAAVDAATVRRSGWDGRCEKATIEMPGARRFVVRHVAGAGMVLSAWTRTRSGGGAACRSILLDDTRALEKLAADAGVALPDLSS